MHSAIGTRVSVAPCLWLITYIKPLPFGYEQQGWKCIFLQLFLLKKIKIRSSSGGTILFCPTKGTLSIFIDRCGYVKGIRYQFICIVLCVTTDRQTERLTVGRIARGLPCHHHHLTITRTRASFIRRLHFEVLRCLLGYSETCVLAWFMSSIKYKPLINQGDFLSTDCIASHRYAQCIQCIRY